MEIRTDNSAVIAALEAKVSELEKAQSELVSAILAVEHERGGSLCADGQFYYYKVPESVFNQAKALKESSK